MSVPLFVRKKKINIGHNFWMESDRAFLDLFFGNKVICQCHGQIIKVTFKKTKPLWEHWCFRNPPCSVKILFKQCSLRRENCIVWQLQWSILGVYFWLSQESNQQPFGLKPSMLLTKNTWLSKHMLKSNISLRTKIKMQCRHFWSP